MSKIRVAVKVEALFNAEDVKTAALEAVQAVMDDTVMPHFVEVAKNRAPVGKDEPAGTNKRSFKAIAVRNPDSFKRGADKDVAVELSSLGIAGRRAFVKAGGKNALRFFRGVGKNRNSTPTEIVFRNNTLKGVFKGQRQPGRLRDSIAYVGSRRVGNAIVGTAQATAPHAAAVHDGFTHKGGPDHSGASSHVAGQPFFEWAIPNIEDDFGRLQG